MSPITGPAFLSIYVALFGAGFVARWLIRRHLGKRAPGRATAEPLQLSAIAAGYLAGGAPRAHAARVLAAREGAPEATSLHAADPQERLVELGLILDARQRAALRLWSGAIFGGLLAAGLARVWVGVSRDKPVGWLLLLLLGVAAALFWSVKDHSGGAVRTPAGRRALSELSRRYKARRGDASCAMGFALFGWSAISDNAAAQAQLLSHGIVMPTSSGGGCTATSGCTSGGSGCSGGGSGCGGGGGCGGCGGGS